MRQAREASAPVVRLQEIGTITKVSLGVATITGLPGVGFEELIRFKNGMLGIAFNVDETEVGVILLGEYEALHAGDEVTRTGRVMDVAVGDALLGRVIDPLGQPLDGQGAVKTSARTPIECAAAAIMDRSPVEVPLQTGLKVIDAMIPIGRGQRELILGDRQTGKTAIAIDSILNQRGANVLCVYCAVGQRASAVAKVIAQLRDYGALEYCVVVVADGNQAPGLSYIAPYAATSIAEFFMRAGRDVLIIYDDLTHHAESYRELSLLLRRPPGREAFPGDIFYLHSRLLERATHLSDARGGGSLTALPIIETEGQDISAYIPTNLISITDGQIYLSPVLFELGILPAVDVSESVSRVGGSAQRGAYRAVADGLKLAYAQFEELESFARVGTHLDEVTRRVIDHGQRIRACLKQPESAPIPVAEQIVVLLALANGLLAPVALEKIDDAQTALRRIVGTMTPEVVERLTSAKTISAADRDYILGLATQSLAALRTPADAPSKEPAPTRPAPSPAAASVAAA
jgi:F-type H+-transporting ATPase subunit alpha